MLKDGRSISRSLLLVKISAGVIAALLIGAGVAIWLLRQGAIADTEEDSHRLGVVLAEQTMRTLQSVDLVIDEYADWIIASGVNDRDALKERFGGLDIHEAMVKRLTNLPQADSFAILDADGHVVNGSREWPQPRESFADQSYFRHLATTPEHGPYLSEPEISLATGKETVFLARRLVNSARSFLGVVIAPIRMDYFHSLFSDAGLSVGEGITLLRRDGIVLARYPAAGAKPGMLISPHVGWREMVAGGGGHYRSTGGFSDNIVRLVSVHPLKLYPVVVDVTREEYSALARWRRHAAGIGLSVLIACSGLGFLLHALRRHIAIIAHSRRQIDRQIETIRASEIRLATQSEMLQTTLDHMNQGLVMVDAEGRVAICNRRFIELFELPDHIVAGHPRSGELIEFLRQRGEFEGLSEDALEQTRLIHIAATYERRRPNGTIIEIRSEPLAGGGMVRTYSDVTARTAAEEMLGLAASHDQLTGLVNRSGFGIALDTALATARRSNTTLALLCLDLDRFKAVNDTLGHEAGDQLLIAVAGRMRDINRATDIIARLGGDEFAIVLPGATQTGAEQVCDRLLESIRAPYTLNHQPARIGVSIGIAIFPNDGSTAQQLLINADTALYRAKSAGRNNWCAYITGDAESKREQMQLEQDFRLAVELEQFTLAYQPICDGVTRQPFAFEALLRWTHPTRGPIAPEEFIPIAELTGLIIPLGRWVIEAACTEAAAWTLPLCISVNLSPAQFRSTDLLGFIIDVLHRTGLPATRLHLEVTEGLLLNETEDSVDTMHRLRQMGVRIVLDDFGITHPNLGCLRGLPVDTVKIDRNFLRALNTDRHARALVEALLGMARVLGLDVIGEGVETAEQLALLCHLQCRWVQGYLLGRPATNQSTRNWIGILADQSANRVATKTA